jgi:hypothetical protein
MLPENTSCYIYKLTMIPLIWIKTGNIFIDLADTSAEVLRILKILCFSEYRGAQSILRLHPPQLY